MDARRSPFLEAFGATTAVRQHRWFCWGGLGVETLSKISEWLARKTSCKARHPKPEARKLPLSSPFRDAWLYLPSTPSRAPAHPMFCHLLQPGPPGLQSPLACFQAEDAARGGGGVLLAMLGVGEPFGARRPKCLNFLLKLPIPNPPQNRLRLNPFTFIPTLDIARWGQAPKCPCCV